MANTPMSKTHTYNTPYQPNQPWVPLDQENRREKASACGGLIETPSLTVPFKPKEHGYAKRQGNPLQMLKGQF